ncbi:hypothetical protein CTM97_06975 [Photobacterium phosphoreum]|nr:hypothetical protein CTM97_06975 [Photobacterium phosphoreum]
MLGGALMFGMASPVHSAIFRKKPESNDSGFFSSVGNDNGSVVVQLIRLFIGKLSGLSCWGAR